MYNYSGLLKKSDENYEIADVAASKEYYDVAVSRYYYCLYQRILCILFSKSSKYSPQKNGDSSHEYALDEVKQLIFRKCQNKLTDADCTDITMMTDLKRKRIQADYNDRAVTEDEFNKEFKEKFDSVYSLLNKVISL